MRIPIVSVIMPVFNGEEYISRSVRSILDQSFHELELIVVSEHGTSQASIAEVDKFEDPRVVHVRNDENLGLIASLNYGVRVAKGRYIARMDSDDISLPNRLAKQVAFMDAHPEVGVLGSQVAYIDAHGKRTSRPRYFWRPETVGWDMLFNSPVPHPSAMLRTETARMLGGYDPNARLVEDYDLWIRASHASTVMNLRDELVLIRKHGENITVTKRDEQNRAAARLARAEMERLLGRTLDEQEVFRLRHPREIADGAGALRAADLLNELYGRYVTSRKISLEALREIRTDLARRYSVLVSVGTERGWKVTGALLGKAREGADLSRTMILAQASVRRVIR